MTVKLYIPVFKCHRCGVEHESTWHGGFPKRTLQGALETLQERKDLKILDKAHGVKIESIEIIEFDNQPDRNNTHLDLTQIQETNL